MGVYRLYGPRVGWSATVGAWARREAVLVSCLAAAGAIVLLAGPLGVGWLRVAGVIVAVVGALARVVIAIQRARLEGAREKAESARRLRVPVAPIGEVDPTLIGVDRAAQRILAGGVVPEYVGRMVDDAVRAAVAAAALEGSGPWLVVVAGRSKVGKSRTLFEALRQSVPGGGLALLAPVDGDALRWVLEPGASVGRVVAPAVLWLDDIEPFLNQGVTLQTLREWQAGIPGRIVAATHGGKGSELVARSSSWSGVATLAFDDVLQHGCQVSLEATTAGELGGLRSRLSEGEFEAVGRHGLAGYLVAGPALERKLTTGRHAPGEDACPVGVALVYAATDWARCGRTDPLSEVMLRGLWPSHLPPGVRATDDALAVGLDWALRPVAGTIALLERTDSGYGAYDYVVRLVGEKPGAEPPRDPSWAAALGTATDVQAFAVAIAAYKCSRFEDTVAGFARVRESSIDELAASAGFNLGVVLGELDRSVEAIGAYEEVMARFGEAPEPVLREQVAMTLVNKGVALGELGRSAEAIGVFEQVVTRFAEAPEPALREPVATALVSKGIALGQLGRSAEAIGAYEQVVTRFAEAPEPALRERVAQALVGKGVRLRVLGRSGEAIDVYEQVVTRFAEAPEPALREQVANALYNKGVVLGELGRSGEAIGVYEQVVTRFAEAPEPALREPVARTLVNKGIALGQLGRSAEAIGAYEQVVTRFAEAPEPALREHVARALVGKGIALGQLGRSGEAIGVYEQVVTRFAKAPEPALREAVVLALSARQEIDDGAD